MRSARVVIGFTAAVLAMPLPAQMPARTAEFDAESRQFSEKSDPAADKVRLRRDFFERMTVAVHVDGSGPYQFLVDTGADRTAISREVAESLNLKPGPITRLHTVTGALSVATAVMPKLKFAREPVQVREAPILERSDVGADGILALDSLRSQQVEFDFRKKTMSIVPSGRARREEPGTIVVTAKARGGRLVVSKAKADKLPVTIVLDTGSELCIGNAALRRQLSRSETRSFGRVELVSVTGATLAGDYTVVKRLKLGGVELSNVAVVFADAHTFKQLDLEDRPALLLGMNAIRAFDVVTIDFARKKLRVTLPRPDAPSARS